MTPQWDFDFIDRTPSRRKRGPILALLAVALLALLWWQQQRNAEAEALQAAVALAQQHLREAQLKAQANAAQSQSLDTSAWDVAWLDERLRELETCVPGKWEVRRLSYKAASPSIHATLRPVEAANINDLVSCINSERGNPMWSLTEFEGDQLSQKVKIVARLP